LAGKKKSVSKSAGYTTLREEKPRPAKQKQKNAEHFGGVRKESVRYPTGNLKKK